MMSRIMRISRAEFSSLVYITTDGTTFEKAVFMTDAEGSYYPYPNGRQVYVDSVIYVADGYDGVTESEFFSELTLNVACDWKLTCIEKDVVIRGFAEYPEGPLAQDTPRITVVERPARMHEKRYTYMDIERARKGGF